MDDTIIKYWLKPSTYNTVLTVYASLPFIIVPALFFVNAPYGKFAGKLGIDWSLSGKWSWCVMELISPITFIVSVVLTRPTGTHFQIIMISAWILHYLNRSIIYPFRAPSMAPIHILTFLSSIVFNLMNGYTNGMWIARHSRGINDLQFWTGMVLWALGCISNIYHDTILFKLRLKKKEKEEQEHERQRYFIPYGGLFEYISCPNYFSETIEWIGYAIASHSSLPAIVFAIGTAANLFPRAWRTHAWYRKEFKQTYPSSRKAIIPFLF
ncbi:3-oxo-5-alpha-steroid 4-dehydrogenase-domain-containing protein [Cokeromyces recurvatus]|uniref:3-oxo-5-alpha-steroid 4-dehydrogenase-domain-containing protein n=1 Tax=Cokeromyces recurvatus TaxID=90255 RepID=UPI0022208A90|nr:3-oxo-5-alpha-steroid 4-dehydrogenase-domain-containing protein [Cokeromyces recurvatus]KAI7906181.1 3-oxo-5-alpha-steroid 4-dehydrogenase-domain-containing protein [Cokeromyces recurvatus]